MRGAGDGAEIDHVVAHVQVPVGIARMEDEAFRDVRQLRLDDVPPETHHLRLLLDESARAPEDFARCGAADLEPRLLENPKRRDQNALQLLSTEDLQGRPAIGEPR